MKGASSYLNVSGINMDNSPPICEILEKKITDEIDSSSTYLRFAKGPLGRVNQHHILHMAIEAQRNQVFLQDVKDEFC